MERLKQIKKWWSKRPLVSRLWILGLCLLVFTQEIQQVLKNSSAGASLKLAARRDLSVGMILSVHDITVKLEPKNNQQDTLTFSDQDIHEVVGRRLLSDLPAGTLLLRSHLEPSKMRLSQKVPKGLRAYLIRTQSRLPLEPGDHIDLFSKQLEPLASPHKILEDKKILGINKREDHQEVLVALSPDDIRHLQSSNTDDGVEVMLRNPMEETAKEPRKQISKNKKKRAIEIWEGS